MLLWVSIAEILSAQKAFGVCRSACCLDASQHILYIYIIQNYTQAWICNKHSFCFCWCIFFWPCINKISWRFDAGTRSRKGLQGWDTLGSLKRIALMATTVFKNPCWFMIGLRVITVIQFKSIQYVYIYNIYIRVYHHPFGHLCFVHGRGKCWGPPDPKWLLRFQNHSWQKISCWTFEKKGGFYWWVSKSTIPSDFRAVTPRFSPVPFPGGSPERHSLQRCSPSPCGFAFSGRKFRCDE